MGSSSSILVESYRQKIDRLIELENARFNTTKNQHNEVISELEKLKQGVSHELVESVLIINIPRTLRDIIPEKNHKNYPKDTRIKFNIDRAMELVTDFLRLCKYGALSEKDLGLWLCSEFQGFPKLKKKVIIRPVIQPGNLTYFIKNIYDKYGQQDEARKKFYRELIERASTTTASSIKQHFTHKPKKYPPILNINLGH